MMEQIEHLQVKIDHQLTLAKDFGRRKNTTQAKLCLKRKAMFESTLKRTEGMMLNLDTRINTLETMQQNAFSYKVMQESSAVLGSIMKTMDVEVVKETLVDIEMDMKHAAEIGDYMGIEMNGESTVTDKQIENELADLLAEDDMKALEETIVPNHALSTPSQQQQQQLQPVSRLREDAAAETSSTTSASPIPYTLSTTSFIPQSARTTNSELEEFGATFF
jgi:hypothetical protein